MINILDLNREHLVPQSKNKEIEDIGLSDLKLSMREIANAERIDFTCNIESKVKLLKHRWGTNIGEVRGLEL